LADLAEVPLGDPLGVAHGLLLRFRCGGLRCLLAARTLTASRPAAVSVSARATFAPAVIAAAFAPVVITAIVIAAAFAPVVIAAAILIASAGRTPPDQLAWQGDNHRTTAEARDRHLVGINHLQLRFFNGIEATGLRDRLLAVVAYKFIRFRLSIVHGRLHL
jgi:hypothetical protein